MCVDVCVYESVGGCGSICIRNPFIVSERVIASPCVLMRTMKARTCVCSHLSVPCVSACAFTHAHCAHERSHICIYLYFRCVHNTHIFFTNQSHEITTPPFILLFLLISFRLTSSPFFSFCILLTFLLPLSFFLSFFLSFSLWNQSSNNNNTLISSHLISPHLFLPSFLPIFLPIFLPSYLPSFLPSFLFSGTRAGGTDAGPPVGPRSFSSPLVPKDGTVSLNQSLGKRENWWTEWLLL